MIITSLVRWPNSLYHYRIIHLSAWRAKASRRSLSKKWILRLVARLLLEFTRGWGQMLKQDYKALIAANQFDLTTLPICGARTRSGGLWKHKGIHNGRYKRHAGASTGPINQTFGKNNYRYVHGLRTKEIVIIGKLLSRMTKSLNALNVNRSAV